MNALNTFFKFSLLPFLLLQCYNRPAGCQQSSNGTVHLGDSLVAGGNQTWTSYPNGTFVFGFFAIDSKTSQYHLGIWYGQLPIQTIVWGLPVDSNGEQPTLVAGAKVTLTNNGSLEVTNSSQGGVVVWSSGTGGAGVASASLLDSGNFVLSNSTGSYLWQSWNTPSDTLLPNQTLAQNGVLTARNSPHLVNANVYPYILSMLASGDLVLYFNKTNNYWSGGSTTGTTASNPNRAYFDAYGTFQLLNTSGVAVQYVSSDYGTGPLRRVTLTPDGNLVTYTWDTSALNWTSVWQAMSNECQIYGWCGRNGLCTYSQTASSCSCFPGYGSLSATDPRQGCEILMPLNCSAGLKMVTLPNTYFLRHSSDYLFNGANTVICPQRCQADTGSTDTLQCVASTLDNQGQGYCFQKRTRVFSAYYFPTSPADSFLKLCASQAVSAYPATARSSSGKSGRSIILVVVVGCLAGLVGLLLLLLAWPCLVRRKLGCGLLQWKRPESQETPVDYVPGAPVRLSYRELQRATKNFSEKLGAGGFGTVYKGELEDNTVVAVKQLEDVVEQGEQEFRTEVSVIGSTHHINLVRLHGFCSEKAHRLLVYEYLSRGSLDNYLVHGSETTTTTTTSSSSASSASAASNSSRPQTLTWQTRFSIALGAARGITYLHEECRECIVHCDIKPENILLDENFCPKVSDFGLAKLLGLRGVGRHITTIRGTRGYLAPEWGANLPLTPKADVFSFGMVLLELVVGTRALNTMASDSEQVRFPAWVHRELMEGNLVAGIKEQAAKEGQWIDPGHVERVVHTAFWCILDEPTSRPTMGKVVQMLEGTITVEPPPTPPTRKT